MRSSSRARLALAVVALAAALGCGGSSSSSGGGGSDTGTPSGGGTPPAPITIPTGDNVMRVTVNGAFCGAGSYLNKPCVEVKVCTPGTQTCVTIQDILLDTGSFGLRLFKQAVTGLSLQPVASGAGQLAECTQYADGTSQWGPVQTADVVLGNEPAVRVPIQVIDATYAIIPASCTSPEADPAAAGFNGILGVGVFAEDCGMGCAKITQNESYYTCTSAGCAQTTVPVQQQVQNPVAALPADGNGLVLAFPSVTTGGVASLDGYMLLGIGTRTNNVPAGVKTFPLDNVGEFLTTVQGGTQHPGFIDTGSNGLFFDPRPNTIQTCASPNTAWFCPPSLVSLSATNAGANGTPTATVPFQIGNLVNLTRDPSRNVFVELGGAAVAGGAFDWGLPFYFGRTVYLGIEGRQSSLGTGPYVAY